MSLYGEWSARHGVPVFCYRVDQDALAEAEWDPIQAPRTRRHWVAVGNRAILLQVIQAPRTRRHWVAVGNRAILLQVANDGSAALFDERYGLRWLAAPDPRSGVSIVEEGAERWGSGWEARPAGTVPLRTFGPTWFEVAVRSGELSLERTVLCPEGEVTWVLVRVRLGNAGAASRRIRHIETWAVAPRLPERRRRDRRSAHERRGDGGVRRAGAGSHARRRGAAPRSGTSPRRVRLSPGVRPTGRHDARGSREHAGAHCSQRLAASGPLARERRRDRSR
jgi:hypothetical protein